MSDRHIFRQKETSSSSNANSGGILGSLVAALTGSNPQETSSEKLVEYEYHHQPASTSSSFLPITNVSQQHYPMGNVAHPHLAYRPDPSQAYSVSHPTANLMIQAPPSYGYPPCHHHSGNFQRGYDPVLPPNFAPPCRHLTYTRGCKYCEQWEWH